MFAFLRALGLNPIEWEEAVTMTGKGSPYVGEILDAAFSNAKAVVAVLTGDDLAFLRQELRGANDPDYEKRPTPQPRQNVLFEAGMAFGHRPDQTIIVEIGQLRPFSDAVGRHAIRLDHTAEKRNALRQRLVTAGCAVKESGSDWLKAGDFKDPSVSAPAVVDKGPFTHLEETIPDFLDVLATKLAEKPLLRYVVITEEKATSYNWRQPHVHFSMDDDPYAREKIRILESNNLASWESSSTEQTVYRISEDLATYLRKGKTGTAKA